MRQRHPMLAVTRKDEHQQGGEESQRFAVGKNLVEHPPCSDADEEADDEREDLPRERIGWNEAGREIEDRTEKRAERHEGRDELCRTEKVCDPREGPVVPVEAGEWEQKPVGNDGDDRDQKSLTRCGGKAELHSVIIRDCGELKLLPNGDGCLAGRAEIKPRNL